MSTKYCKTTFFALLCWRAVVYTLFLTLYKKFIFQPLTGIELWASRTLSVDLTPCPRWHAVWWNICIDIFVLCWLQIFYLFTKLVKNITLFNPLNLTSIYNLLIEETRTLNSPKNVLMDTTKLANIDFQTPQVTGFRLMRNAARHQIDPRWPK